ncbi:MarR family transcriptional regulator [Pseudonocardia xishanensis]|uniref:HTH marR-type domain-containing protein n=1 Tax=Pseudonocardia xishanensis TaxID=630995 RepID=A0ABP8RYE8_9PSEU
MISTSTAADVVSVIRELVALGRSVRQPGEVAETGGPCTLQAGQAAVLGLLLEHGELRIGGLATAMELDASVISRRVALLEESDLVVRRADPEDRRAQLVGITERGSAALRHYRAARADEVAAALLHREDAEVARIVADLRGLLADLNRTSTAGRHRTAVG